MKKAIKILIALLIIFLTSSNTFAQKSGTKNFIGFWTSDQTTTRLVFFLDKNDKLQLICWDSDGGEEMEIMELKIYLDKIQTTERFKSTNHVTYNEFVVVNENRLMNIINGDTKETIFFKRIK